MLPVMLIFFGFDTKQAIALSNASQCVSSICRYFYNLNKSHPLKGGYGVLVDYNVASLMLPMAVVGASVGVMLNIVLPSFVVITSLLILLFIMFFTTLKKLRRIMARETE